MTETKTMTMSALRTWLDGYGDAWEARDPEAAGRLFSEEACYQVTPFDQPIKGREGIEAYWREATAQQSDIHFTSKAIAINGLTGVGHWTVKVRIQASGQMVELDGVFVLEFNVAGQCSMLREWFLMPPGK